MRSPRGRSEAAVGSGPQGRPAGRAGSAAAPLVDFGVPLPLGRAVLRSPLAEEGAGRDRVRSRTRPYGRDLNIQPGGHSGLGGAGPGHAN